MHHPLSATRRVALTLAVAVVAGGGLAACGTSPNPSTGASGGSGASGPASGSASTSPLVLRDGWVKAVEATGTASMPMTGLFGTLHNPTGSAVTVTGGSSPVAGKVELHETVRTASGSMRMQPKSGGFVIPAGGSQVLRPGGDHVMLMGLTQALPNGSHVTVTLTTSAGEVTVTVPARAFTGAEESYAPTPSAS